jgi:hypothetical protein
MNTFSKLLLLVFFLKALAQWSNVASIFILVSTLMTAKRKKEGTTIGFLPRGYIRSN